MNGQPLLVFEVDGISVITIVADEADPLSGRIGILMFDTGRQSALVHTLHPDSARSIGQSLIAQADEIEASAKAATDAVLARAARKDRT
ncbi:hypothetical protein [Sphingomonas sp. LaA6.9]|uniref:hypothetical protein n=1 Tax=Sphingomonas sp. LaA6.9 TaxID=2919914 RepID=UPI001F4FAF80|nr:hypothetical protein [Sphingomonas sp. LaA6.9]MCJ8158830.1 hypothetical protein [Sphingomonas sp. LaA6.9]